MNAIMTDLAGPIRRVDAGSSTWLAHYFLAMLVVVTIGTGWLGVSLAREIFIVGSALVGWVAFRSSVARHLEISILLFAVAPLVRRVVDLHCGYDPQGILLAGPLVAILVPAIELPRLILSADRFSDELWPPALAGLCILYGFFLSAFSANVFAAGVAALKWVPPLIYGVWIRQRVERNSEQILESTVRTLLLVTSVMGVYGIIQFVDPPAWDRMWMIYVRMSAGMNSIGTPEPFKVRVFSTMNSPASYATFACCGLLMLAFRPKQLRTLLIAAPAVVGFLLSQYRTAWLSLLAAVMFLALFRGNRGRGLVVLACVVVIGGFAVMNDLVGGAITERLQTFDQAPLRDGSLQVRVKEIETIYAHSEDYIFGSGLAPLKTDSRIAGLVGLDGTIVSALLSMGIFFGSLLIVALVWAGGGALARIYKAGGIDTLRLAAGAITAAGLFQIPFAPVTTGELGFLFWTFWGIASAAPTGSIDLAFPQGAARAFGRANSR